jgi:phage shock protein A
MTSSDRDDPVDAETVPVSGTEVPPAPSLAQVTGYTETGIPTFDHIRDKIERRAATAAGARELAETLDPEPADPLAEREKAAKARLEQIRRSMRE